MDRLKKLKFVRYGGLSPVKQLGFDPEMPTFHSPPAKYGFYAFVHPMLEMFLIGSSKFLHHRHQWVRDKDGNRVGEGHPDWPNWDDPKVSQKYMVFKDKEKRYLAVDVKPRTFEYEGDIWHHLPVKHYHIIKEMGGWVLTEMAVYKEALKKEVGRVKKFRARNGYGYSNDHFEVFIERL